MSGEGVGEAYVRREVRPRWDTLPAKAKAVLSRRLIYHRFESSRWPGCERLACECLLMT